MPERPDNWEIDIDKAAEILGVSTRTVRRYAKDDKIDHRRVQGKYGQELRFNEDELLQFVQAESKGEDNRGQSGAATDNASADGLDSQSLWQAYRELQDQHWQVVGQLGYLQSLKDRDLPQLKERAESLENEKQQAEQDKAAAEARKTELEETLEQEKQEKRLLRQQLRKNSVLYIVLVLALAAFLVLLSPNYSDLIPKLLTR